MQVFDCARALCSICKLATSKVGSRIWVGKLRTGVIEGSSCEGEDEAVAGFGADQRLTRDLYDFSSALSVLLFGLYLQPASTLIAVITSTIVSAPHLWLSSCTHCSRHCFAYVVIVSLVATFLIVPRSHAYCEARCRQGVLRQAFADVVDGAESISWWVGYSSRRKPPAAALGSFSSCVAGACCLGVGRSCLVWLPRGLSLDPLLRHCPIVVALDGPGSLVDPSAAATGWVGVGTPLDATLLSTALASISALISAASLFPHTLVATCGAGWISPTHFSL